MPVAAADKASKIMRPTAAPEIGNVWVKQSENCNDSQTNSDSVKKLESMTTTVAPPAARAERQNIWQWLDSLCGAGRVEGGGQSNRPQSGAATGSNMFVFTNRATSAAIEEPQLRKYNSETQKWSYTRVIHDQTISDNNLYRHSAANDPSLHSTGKGLLKTLSDLSSFC